MRFLALLATTTVACAPAALPREGAFEESRFVDDLNGDDSSSGLSPQTAWRTLSRVNAFTPRTSTRISFKRGGTWRGFLEVHGGNASVGWVAYGAYGDPNAPKPLFLGSVDVGQGWVATARDDVWELPWSEDTSQPSADVAQGPGNLYFLDAQGRVTRWGFRKQTRAQLSREGDFYYEPAQRRIALVSSAMPEGRIEAARNRTWANFSGQSLLIVEDLELRFVGGYAYRGHDAQHLRFRRLDVSWSGGGTKPGEYLRAGNGLELEGNIEDAIVEDSRFFQIYDTGVDCQKTGETRFAQHDVLFRRNIISRVGLACFELWGRGATDSRFERISFERNTCLFSGEGWGFDQHDHVGQSQIGGDVVVFENSATVSGLEIRENIFHAGRVGLFAEYNEAKKATRALVDGATFDWNLYSRPSRFVALLYQGDDPVLLPMSEKFTTLADWRDRSGKEQHGIEAEMAFVALDAGDPFVDDLRPRQGSAALHASADGGVVGALDP